MHTEITSDMIELVSRVTAGRYGESKARQVITRSLQRSHEGNNEESLFYSICIWIDSNIQTVQNCGSQAELIAIITNELGFNPGSIRSCLASHPFIIPERIKPKKAEPKKEDNEPPSTKYITREVPVVKSLWEVYELESNMKAMEVFIPEHATTLWNKIRIKLNNLFKEEHQQIEKLLKEAPPIPSEASKPKMVEVVK